MFFDEIVGHQAARAYLSDALRASRLPHALLFMGPEGVGKKLVGHRLARILHCERSTGCGECRGCRRVDSHNHPDLMVITRLEKHTVITLQQLVGLQEFLLFEPLESSWRVAIVDDAHLLRPEAQDSLLKTLEEPPANSVLILISHRAERLRPTIRSRCHTVLFAGLEAADLHDLVTGLGLDLPEGFPVELAAGRPGVLRAMLEDGLLEAREPFLDLLSGPTRAPAVHLSAALAAWAGEGTVLEDAVAERERRRGRLRLALGLFGQLLRDAYALRVLGEGASLLNRDRVERLSSAVAPNSVEECDGLVDAVVTARRALGVNVSVDLVLESLMLDVKARLGGVAGG